MARSRGKTAQFWINYAFLMDMYLILHRASKGTIYSFLYMCFIRLVQFSSVQITKTMHIG